MSLNSEEDELKKRQEKQQKKRAKTKQPQTDQDDEDHSQLDTGFQSSMAADDDLKIVDCWTANRKAIETTRTGNYDAYVPECQQDGKYDPTQCYKVRLLRICYL